jgi:hypothetical protein
MRFLPSLSGGADGSHNSLSSGSGLSKQDDGIESFMMGYIRLINYLGTESQGLRVTHSLRITPTSFRSLAVRMMG